MKGMVFFWLLSLSAAIALNGITDIMSDTEQDKRTERLEQKCDSLQRQIDFMVE